jgi:3-phytase
MVGSLKPSHAGLLPLVFVAACAGSDTPPPDIPVMVVEETFLTQPERTSNMDSPAVWRGSGAGETWVIATGKWTHRLHVYDGATGTLIRTVGGRGTEPGEFRRPNGIAIAGDIVLVVERDNARVQALRLPGFEHLVSFGGTVLRQPYGIAVHERDSTEFDIFVTDNYGGFLGRTPDDDELGQRVKRFRVSAGESRVVVTYLGAFGDTAGAGRLRTVESLALDPDAGTLLIADEAARDVKVYRLDGTFTGRVLWRDVLAYEPEGIALYACGADDGYWIVADQHGTWNRFLVFDRRGYGFIGAFTGTAVRNTDGIALMQRSVASMAAGVLYAVHDDRAVGAFSWSDVAAALGLRDDCITGTATAAESEGHPAAQIQTVPLAVRIGDAHALAEAGQPEAAAQARVPPAFALPLEPDPSDIRQPEYADLPAHEQRH